MNCPACGAPVEPAAPEDRVVYCEHCGQALVVLPEGFDARGGRAQLADTPTIVTLGDRATIRGCTRRVAGRVQYRFEAGVYDHFWLAGDEPAWLEQDEGELRLLDRMEAVPDAPGWDDLGIGMPVPLMGGSFYPMEFGEAEVAGGQGHLPLPLIPGVPFQYVDGTFDGDAASLKYVNGAAILLRGESLQASDIVVERGREA